MITLPNSSNIEPAILAALGVDPEHVVPGSVRAEYSSGDVLATVTWECRSSIEPAELADVVNAAIKGGGQPR